MVVGTKKDITKDIKILESPNKNKRIIFFPMMHMGRKGYYESCKFHIDSLRKEGYVFFCEGIKNFTSVDSLVSDTVYRKARKLLGFYLGGRYKNKQNKSTPSHMRNNNYVEQDYYKMGIKETDLWVDYDYYHLVKDYEKAKGEIILTDCDFQTPFLEKYNCNRDDYNSHFAINTLRDAKLEKVILESKHKKIVVIYGKMHWYFVWPSLRDKGYKIIKGKI